MKQNVGTADKIVRFILVLAFVYLGLIYSVWWYLAAAILLITAITGMCGIYSVFGINTCKGGK